MGTKKRLAPRVAAIVQEMRSGAALDLFAGMCSVGKEIAPTRNVWTNDAQRFASEYGAAFFTSRPPRHRSYACADIDTSTLGDNVLQELVQMEAKALTSTKLAELKRLHTELASVRANAVTNSKLYFAHVYAGTYLGLRQCLELDLIQSHIGTITDDSDRRWARIALCVAVYRASTSTGHFAQYLKPKESTHRFFLRKRRLSLLSIWTETLNKCRPLGNATWRRDNRSYFGDAVAVLKSIHAGRKRPAVIYADPPYTRDHYSRYYHLYETVWSNDRPDVMGEGLCRTDVKPSQFSTKSQVNHAMNALFDEAAAIGADILFSYPTNGLLDDARSTLTLLLKQRYSAVTVFSIPGNHSTLGASKGLERQAVTELLFKATSAR